MTLVEPAVSIRGAIEVPGVKGICQRGVLLGAVADGETEIRGFGRAADTQSAIDVVRQLGVEVTDVGDEVVRVHGVGLHGLRSSPEPLDCGNAGTVMRLAAGLLAGQSGKFTLVGDESLSSRPQERIAVPLRALGATVETTDGHAPLTISGGSLQPIRHELPVASAQVKSAVILAGLYTASGPTEVIEPAVTRDHTERMLTAMGVRVAREPGKVSVWPAERLRPLSIDVPGDISSAAPFIAAATLLTDSELHIRGVNVNATRTGFLDVLERMGGRVAVYNRRSLGGEPVADLEVRHAELIATNVDAQEVPLLVDELPLFCLLAAMARGASVVRGAADLRAKETDRIETTTEALRGIGAHIKATEDGFHVRGVPARLRGGVVNTRGDHRIAMLGAVAGLASREGVELLGAESVDVSFPGFFDLLTQVKETTVLDSVRRTE
ncbi:MAG: 3-phosphoshikimate 1-carboxyvinyltransferase [Actinobacteria bacterium]|nr:MAG: 3-phosphoshikimate 1-carboxyvinyltransferase [Actinomycetota bacterium]